MKASVKLRRDREGRVQKKPIVKAKLPFDLLGFPVHAGLKVCGHIQELALRLSSARVIHTEKKCDLLCEQDAGPSLEVSYRPHEPDRPFTLSFKTGFSPWPSSPASALTMAAEFNLSRPSTPTFLLKVKPQLGDFSFRHDFRSKICRGGVMGSSSDDHRHDDDGLPCHMGFTNAFARYDSRLHLPDNVSSPWHAPNESFDIGQHPRYDATGNVNLASFDSTPYASEKAGYARLDSAKFSSEFPTTPSQIFAEEKRFQELGQHPSAGTDWEPLRDNLSRQDPAFSRGVSRMDDDWERIGDAVSRSTTSASSSTQQNKDDVHANVQRRTRHSRSTSSLAGWAVRDFCAGSHLRACTHLPISSEARLKIRWSVGASSSSSRAPLLPLLLLDKVSLEAAGPCAGAHRTPVLLPFSNAPKNETMLENATHLKQVKFSLSMKARDESMSEGCPTYAGLEGELKPVHELRADNVNMKKTSFLSQFLHGKVLLD